jgi:2-keto-4-pentenoate hydratase/2-oxohepta-3-ene-1,7-dioic acid hydratase in catechol pathway
MRLATFSWEGRPRIGAAVSAAELVDLAHIAPTRPYAVAGDMIALIREGPTALAHIADALRNSASDRAIRRFRFDEVEWMPPVLTPTKIVCIALNNRALDAIKLRAPTDHPAFFIKSQTALVGHGQSIPLRHSYGLTHPEPELAVIIGRRLKDADPAHAFDAVFGYTIMNDVTSVGMREEDSFTFRYFRPDPLTGETVPDEGHTTYPGRYKGSDGFAPLGPLIVTRDEIPDPAALDIKCWLGSRLVASDNTRNYVWSVAAALSHISQTMTLLPGDVFSMGTAVGGESDAQGKAGIPGITKANLVGNAGPVAIEIAGLGRLCNPITTRI